jgi:hypothetical protein
MPFSNVAVKAAGTGYRSPPFPQPGLRGAPRSDSRTRPGTKVAGGVPQTSTLTMIVVKVDGEKKA